VDAVRRAAPEGGLSMLGLAQTDVVEIVTFVVCVGLASMFSVCETAITSLGSLKAKHILEEEGRANRQLNLWHQHPSRVLTTIVIFATIVHTLASAVATDLAARYFASQAIGVATGATTLALLVFGEITPKSYGRTHAETAVGPALRIIYVLYVCAWPIVWVFSEFAGRFVKLVGGPKSQQPPITEEELEFLVNVGERAGVLEETKKDMIVSVFEFDETKVREIMTPRPDIRWLTLTATFEDAVVIAMESGMSRIPICSDEGIDHVVGVLLVKDLLPFARTASKEHRQFDLRQMMREPFFVPESKLIMEVFKELKGAKSHIAIVIDEHGGTAGLVTMEDILEEIVGEIQDEYDVEEAEMLELEPGIYDVAGSAHVDEFLEFFELDRESLPEKPEEDFDTIGGWITSLLGELPEVGKTVRIGPLNIEISDVERHRIRRVRVSRILDRGEIDAVET
jgi:CBS domain containing-hemolysin-like protein